MTRRAVVVSPDPANRAGGTERLCAAIAALLERLGFDVALVGPAGPGPHWVDHNGLSTLWQARSARTRAAAMAPADLIVTSGFLGWPGDWGGRRVHVYVGNLVRLARHQGGKWHWRLRWGAAGGLAEALAARGAADAVAISEQAAEDARRLYRAPVSAVLGLGVDTRLFRPRDREEARRRLGLPIDGRYALFVGRGEPGKGPEVALAAARRAGFRLLAAGTRPVDGSVPLGVLASEELAWAYAAADAVVLPTRYEGFGYVAVESLASGVPIVTTPTGWALELGRDVPEYRPFLVSPSVDEVAAALGRVATAEAGAAVAAGRSYVLTHNTQEAFERRWTEWFDGVGVLA